jgi:SAM-dependent methyltransferase
MHLSSLQNMQTAIAKIKIKSNLKIMDVGGRDLSVERSYYSILKSYASEYHIADICNGPNVTHLMSEPYSIPSDDEYYDLIVSGQTLEHVKNPFRLVSEMKRILKTNGHMILIAPSTGKRHDINDCWRFMDDAFRAIAEECELETVDDWITNNSADKGSQNWNDHVFIGRKYS